MHSQLVHSILELLQHDWEVKLVHVYRESNHATDFMAEFAKGLSIDCHSFDSPPLGIVNWLDYDKLENGFDRVMLLY